MALPNVIQWIKNLEAGIDGFGTNIAALQSQINSLNGAMPFKTRYARFVEQYATNTPGGTFTAGAWRTRALNTAYYDNSVYISMSGGNITLSAGTYVMYARAPAYEVDRHKCRIVLNSPFTPVYGGNMLAIAGNRGYTDSVCWARFILASQASVQLQHWCGATKATDGFGLPNTDIISVHETYAELDVWRVA